MTRFYSYKITLYKRKQITLALAVSLFNLSLLMMGLFSQTLTIFLFVHSIRAKVNDRYYPRYHLAPPSKWMNDPNGFSYFKGEYHLFYQFSPNTSSSPVLVHWGHAKSTDLIHWEHLPIALYPDQTYDRSGVFSGSALIENDTMYLYYTGHKINSATERDYEERQALAISTDGNNFVKYEFNPVINGSNYQPDIRDPKVWKHGDTYYMVLGHSFAENNNRLGRILLYSSTDKINWQEVSELGRSNGTLGYMWECPDFFQLNGRFILLFSPQGVEADGDKYKNLYQTGYIVGNFDYQTLNFTEIKGFRELDHGHDVYATQTILDRTGRRIVVAWFDMWETTYPESDDGFHGQVTIPRELSLTSDLRLIQKPVVELRSARSNIIRTGTAAAGTTVTLENKAAEVNIRAPVSQDFELHIESGSVLVTILFDATNGLISLDRGGEDGVRRTEWQPTTVLVLNIYIDASSIEVFCGSGEVTFSSRYFPDGDVNVRIGDNSQADQMRVINMNRVVPTGEE